MARNEKEDEIVFIIIVVTVVLLAILGVYLWFNRKQLGLVSNTRCVCAVIGQG